MNVQVSAVLHFRAVKPISSAHCERSTLRLDQSAGSETCNRNLLIFTDRRRDWGRVAESTNKLQKCPTNDAELLQMCRKKMSFCLVSLV